MEWAAHKKAACQSVVPGLHLFRNLTEKNECDSSKCQNLNGSIICVNSQYAETK